MSLPTTRLNLVPSSKAHPTMPSPTPTTYILSVQRLTTGGRWREIASWQVTTSEADMHGPLNCGLKPNYRIVVTAAKHQPAAVDGEPK